MNRFFAVTTALALGPVAMSAKAEKPVHPTTNPSQIGSRTRGDKSERNEIESVINSYFLGMYRRDLPMLRGAFHPSARLFGHLDHSFVELPIEEWLGRVKSSRRKQGADRRAHRVSV
ncbi:MAG: nuclear transport factor 2 family protein [Myxococcaceae bacterium]